MMMMMVIIMYKFMTDCGAKIQWQMHHKTIYIHVKWLASPYIPYFFQPTANIEEQKEGKLLQVSSFLLI